MQERGGEFRCDARKEGSGDSAQRSSRPSGISVWGAASGALVLAFTRYCFASKLYCGSQSSFPPPPTCKAYPIAILGLTRLSGVGALWDCVSPCLRWWGLAFTRYCLTSSRLCTNQSSVHCSRPPALPMLLQYYCMSIGQYTTPPSTSILYAIHHTILVITISCKGQGGGGCAGCDAREEGRGDSDQRRRRPSGISVWGAASVGVYKISGLGLGLG